MAKTTKAIFYSNWVEGLVDSPCEVDLDTGEIINIETVDVGEEFESFIDQTITIFTNQDIQDFAVLESNGVLGVSTNSLIAIQELVS